MDRYKSKVDILVPPDGLREKKSGHFLSLDEKVNGCSQIQCSFLQKRMFLSAICFMAYYNGFKKYCYARNEKHSYYMNLM